MIRQTPDFIGESCEMAFTNGGTPAIVNEHSNALLCVSTADSLLIPK
ncbi:hypothetical protein [Niastella populi]|nr:hypothetical protein [Niastella populi]